MAKRNTPQKNKKTHIICKNITTWWFQPIWKILVKLEIFQIGVKIKNISNHHLDKLVNQLMNLFWYTSNKLSPKKPEMRRLWHPLAINYQEMQCAVATAVFGWHHLIIPARNNLRWTTYFRMVLEMLPSALKTQHAGTYIWLPKMYDNFICVAT